jgi:DNA-binding protein Fis
MEQRYLLASHKKAGRGEGKTLKRELDTLITQMHSAGIAYNEAVRQFKKRYIHEVLANHKGNQCKAAHELGMHRNTLSRTLAELDMDTARIRSGMRRPPRSERGAEHLGADGMGAARLVQGRDQGLGAKGLSLDRVGSDRPRTELAGQRVSRLHNIA